MDTAIGKRVVRLKEELDAVRPLAPDVEQRVLQKLRLDWNYHSNAIEGNSLDHGETRAFLMHGITAKGKPLKDYLDIRGHNQAIDYLLSLVGGKEQLRESEIRALHEVILVESYEVPALTADGNPTKRRVHLGRYKSTPNHVRTATGEIHYFVSPEETPIRMQELMDWLYDEATSLYPIERAIVFHHRFVAIHPFDDGNGRMARLLMNLLLLQDGYPPAVIHQEDRGAYYAALAQADDGELLPLQEFICEALARSMEVYLRASRNEPIDEPDDIDKEISLLERDLESRKERLDARDDEESRAHFEEHVFRPVWDSVRRSLMKFRRLFLSVHQGTIDAVQKAASYGGSGDRIWIYNDESVFDDFEEEIYLRIHQQETNSIMLFIQLQDFRDINSSFSVEVRLRAAFDEFSAAIGLWLAPAGELDEVNIDSLGSTGPFHELRLRYRHPMSEFDLRELARNFERGMLSYIKDHDGKANGR